MNEVKQVIELEACDRLELVLQAGIATRCGLWQAQEKFQHFGVIRSS